MRGISCLVNFKNNISKNIPYYDLLIRQINGTSSGDAPWICEQAILFSECTLSKICEGYQFTIAFFGSLTNSDALKNELSAFGYHFLTDKDAEVALFCYIHFGEKCAQKLSGEFTFIIYDAMRRQIFALTDALGSTPVFYAKTGDEYVVSTSFKSIFAHPDISKKISAQNLLELLSCENRIPEHIMDDVYTLPASSFLKISKGGIKKGCYTASGSSPKNDFACAKKSGVILSGTSLDFALLENLVPLCEKEHTRTSVYAEKFSNDFGRFPARNQHLSVDDGTVLWALETVVTAYGFPFVSSYDFLLPMALKRAKGNDETLFFSFPDRFLPKKNYITTLIKNGAFYSPLEENMKNYTPCGDILAPYPSMIADFFETSIKTPLLDGHIYNEITPSPISSGRIKTALRHILLDIISKEHSPIIAFFKRAALLRLCEGGFSFGENEDESQLIAYLIKLNMWFEIFLPRII